MRKEILNTINTCLMLINKNNFFLARILINKEITQNGFSKDLLEILLQIDVSEEKWENAEKTAILLLDINRNDPKAYNNYGYILFKLRKLEDSIVNYKKAIDLNNVYTDAYNNLGVALEEIKQYDEAIYIYKKAINLNIKNIDPLINLASLLSVIKNYDEAKIYYEKAILLDKKNPLLLNNYANLLKEIGDYNNACKYYDDAISLDSMYLDALFNRTDLHRLTMNLNKALSDVNLLINMEKNALNYCIKGYITRDLCMAEESKNSFENALNLDSNCVEAKWSLPFAKLIPIYSVLNINKLIEEIEISLNKLDIWVNANNNQVNIESGVGATLPFYLAYLPGQNKKIFELYGNICTKVMKEWQQGNNLKKIKRKKNEKNKIRIGIIGSHFTSHSVWHAVTKGIVTKLNKEIFSISIFNLSTSTDYETIIAKSNANEYYKDQGGLYEWYRCIVQSGCDILIYPEIGMHQLTYQLACLRISDLQLCLWGHPETTGLKTIDYYISAELFETDISKNNYSEKLVELPNLGTYLYEEINLFENEINGDVENIDIPVIVCGGMLYKYQLMYDWIFVQLVKKIGQVKILFFTQHIEWKDLFFSRLKLQFDKEGLIIENFVHILEFHDKKSFSKLLKKSTLLLDTIGFSGFNTALMAIESGLPIVSINNNSLKSNLTNAILTRMELKELIAVDFNEYFNIILKLIQDKNFYNNVEKKIKKNKKILYGDIKAISEFEYFLIKEYKNK